MNIHFELIRGAVIAGLLSLVAAPAGAQQMDHSKMQMPIPAKAPPASAPAKKTVRKKKPVVPAVKPAVAPAPQKKAIEAMDHSKMGHDMPMPAAEDSAMDHSAMDHAGAEMAPTEPRVPIPELTDGDRAAAFPPVHGHAAHDNSIKSYMLIDRLEAWDADGGTGLEWEGLGWVGTDLNRLWVRSQGEHSSGRLESAELEILYGRSLSPWWDLVAGIRHDFKPGQLQDFAAIGVIGLAPYKFEVEATAYLGQSGQTAARIELEYDTLLTNRLILQPLIEINFFGKDDELRGIGSGLSTIEFGLRLRYEITRQFAPYIGVVREQSFGRTADFRRSDGDAVSDTRVVAGFRLWF